MCAAAQLVAGAEAAFLAEPTRAATRSASPRPSGAPDLVGHEAPIDPDASIMARAFLLGEPLHLPRADDFPPASRARSSRGVSVALAATCARSSTATARSACSPSGWRDEHAAARRGQEELVAELAAEAARAIERDAHVALLARQARTDELTALPNRRAWDEAVEREMARAERTGEPLCLALLDLDHFKAYNDLHGHQAGDSHLRRTAAAWRRELRAIDVLARYGGEEFGVLLPSCDIKEAARGHRPRPRATPERRVRVGRRRRATTAARAPTRCSPAPTPRCTAPSTPGRATTVPA